MVDARGEEGSLSTAMRNVVREISMREMRAKEGAAAHSVRYLQISGPVIWEQQITESSNNRVQISLLFANNNCVI